MGTMLIVFLMAISREEAILRITGAGTMEELGEEVLERFEALAEHPLDLNRAGRSRLLGSGLFSAYQVASILDYRRSSGVILSLQELSLVDGIGEEYAAALGPFVRLGQGRAGGGTAPEDLHPEGLFTTRSGIRGSPAEGELRDFTPSYASKFKASLGETAQLAAGCTCAPGESLLYSYSAAYYGRGVLGKVVLGDFNARFGQGLALWSGFTMSGVPGVESMRRNPSGISPASSFTGSGRLRGAAADFLFGRWSLTALGTPGMGAMNLAHYSPGGQWSASALLRDGTPVLASDFKFARGKVDFWGEGALDVSAMAPAALLGFGWTPEYRARVAAVARCYPPDYSLSCNGPLRAYSKACDEAGIALGGRWKFISATGDCVRRSGGSIQRKWLVTLSPELKLGAGVMTPSLRFQLRDRPGEAPLRFRSSLRGDMDYQAGEWRLHARYESLWYRDRAWMWYAEGLYRSERQRLRYTAALRGGIFKVDNWDDRIYVYERDLPGMFTSRACYGRGWNLSLLCGLRAAARAGSRLHLSHRLDLRVSYVAYPWTAGGKPERLEARMQYSLEL